MNERGKQFRVLSILLLIAAVCCFVTQIVSLILMKDNAVLISVTSVISALATLTAIYYGFNGFRKSAAAVFKTFMILFAETLFMGVINRGYYLDGTAAAAMTGAMALQFACIAILAVAENLGKTKSMTLCWIVFVITLAAFLTAFIEKPGTLRGGDLVGDIAVIRTGGNVFLSGTALLMTAGKYKDKAIRGTK